MARIRITLKKSPISQKQDQQLTAKSLGLRRMHQSVVVEDSRTVRGMIKKIRHLIVVEDEAD